MNTAVIRKLKETRKAHMIGTSKDTGIELLNGNIVGAIISAVAGMSITLRETRAIELLDRVCSGDEQAKEGLLFTLRNSTHDLHELVTSVILKTIDESNIIKRYLLAKIMSYYIENNGFDYFHEMLFNNINLFNDADFKNILAIDYQIKTNQITKDTQGEWLIFRTTNENRHLIITLLKLASLQILLRGPDGLGDTLKDSEIQWMRISPYNNALNVLVEYLTQLKI